MTVPTPSERWPEAAFWSALAFGVLALKVVGLLLDPQPQFFMGDSASYIHSALTGWVPADRSYLYGQFVRFIVADTQSLAPLVLAQAAAGGATALLAARWAQLVFNPTRPVLCAVALVCTIDPSQLLFERYVMTETFALFAVALMMVALTHVTIRGQWLWMLPAVIAGTVVVALRMSMLPVVLACLAGAPLLALLARTLGPWQTMLCLGVAAIFVPPALFLASRIQTGPFLLAAWSPLLTAQDFPDTAQGERVLKGIDLANPELFAREVNLWHPSGFMHRLTEEVADSKARNRLARETALRVLRRDPIGVANLGWRTYAQLWDTATRLRLMRWDVGQNPLGTAFRETLARSFRLVADDIPTPTLTARYYLSVGLWTTAACLAAPVLVAAAMFRRGRRQAAAIALLVMASSLILLVTGLMTTLPVVRYLHPLGWMIAAVLVAAVGDAVSVGPVRRREGTDGEAGTDDGTR